MHTKTRIFHYIAQNPGIRASKVAKDLDIPRLTVATYVNHLYMENKLVKMKGFGWAVDPSIDPKEIPEYKPPEKIREPWEDLQDALKGFFSGNVASENHVPK